MKHAILCLMLVTMAGCCSHPDAFEVVEDAISTTAGHAADPHNELSDLAQEAFLVDHDSWQRVRLMVFGVPLDPEVQARYKASQEAASAASAKKPATDGE